MTKPGPSVTSGADTQPGSDSLFPSGFGGGAAIRTGGVGTAEIADSSVAAADLNLPSVAAALAARTEFTAAYGQVSVPGGWAGGVAGTRRANFLASGGGFTVGGALADFHQRVIVKIPVNTTRWRLRMVNQRADGTAYSGAITVTGVYVGTPNPSASNPGRWDGNFTTTPTQALSSFALDSAGATATTTSWVTTPSLQFTAGKAALVSMGWTSAATSTARGCGQCWFTSGAGKNADAAVTAPGNSFAGNIQLNWQVEYEFAGSQPVGIALGDSLTEGYYPSVSGSSLLTMADVWHQVLSQRTGVVMAANGYFGSTTANWTTTTTPAWTNWSTSGLTLDFAAIMLGSNDANSGVTLATYQANLNTIITAVRALGIRKVYLGTVAPRSLTTNEALRQSYNAWIRTQPYDVDGVIDADLALASSFGGSAANTGTVDPDNIHWTPVGQRFVGNIAAPLKVA